jgi:hypothetical protein
LLQLRPPNGFESVLDGPVPALAGAANPTPEPRTMAALISVLVIRTFGSRFCNPRADRFRFAIDM